MAQRPRSTATEVAMNGYKEMVKEICNHSKQPLLKHTVFFWYCNDMGLGPSSAHLSTSEVKTG